MRSLLFATWTTAFLLPPPPGHAQIGIPDRLPGTIVDAWLEGRQVILRTEDGRLFSIPLATPGIEMILEGPKSAEEPAPNAFTVADIIDMLRAGVSEKTVQAHIAASRADYSRFELTKDDLIELKQAGASESFLSYLIQLAKPKAKMTWLRWTDPLQPRRPEEPAPEAPEEPITYQEGIPLYPYVFPGYGFSYPYYGGFSGIGCQPPQRQQRFSPEPMGLRPFGASLVKTPEERPQYRSRIRHPKPVPLPQNQPGRTWLRWNAGVHAGGDSAKEVPSGPPASQAASSRRGSAPAPSLPSSGISSHRAIAGADSGGAARSSTGPSTSGGSRSLLPKH